MSFLGVQIISIIFIFFMLYVVQIHFRKRELSRLETIFWYLTFASLAIIVVNPDTAQFLINTFAVSRLLDLIMIVAFMVIFYMLIDTRIQLHKFRSKLEEKVRAEAIKNAKTK